MAAVRRCDQYYTIMKNVLFSVLLLPVLLSAQVVNRFTYSRTSSSLVVFTDDFETYNEAALGGQGNWVAVMNVMEITETTGDKRANPNSFALRVSVRYNQTFAADHYSQGLIDNVSGSGAIGVTVCNQSGAETFYSYDGNTGVATLRRVVAGVSTTLATGDALAATDLLKLETVGDELKCYKNGVLDTSISGDGIFDDGGTISGGGPGIGGFGDSNDNALDNWEGGNL